MSRAEDWKVLGIPRTTNTKEIKDAYRRCALEFHPDTSALPREEARRRFAQLQASYEAVTAPKSRGARGTRDSRGRGASQASTGTGGGRLAQHHSGLTWIGGGRTRSKGRGELGQGSTMATHLSVGSELLTRRPSCSSRP